MRKSIEARIKEKQLKDIGFWTQDGEYIEDLQEIDLDKE